MNVCLVADMLEEKWPSMDLYADMMLDELGRADPSLAVEVFRVPMKNRFGRGAGADHSIADRLAGRHFDYPRAIQRHLPRPDVYHILDHSYAASVKSIRNVPTVVTCHDLDAFTPLDSRGSSFGSLVLSALARRTLAGLRSATHVVCVSQPVRSELISRGWIDEDRSTVIPNGVASEFVSGANASEHVPAELPKSGPLILHVSSTIPRKRIDTLLEAFAGVRREHPDAHLIRVGGPFTRAQQAMVSELDLQRSIATLPFLDRSTLAAVYRRATLVVLPSEKEGFGLPVVEALACGTPVLASDIEVLREVGGSAVSYAPPGDSSAWEQAILLLLNEKSSNPEAWKARIDAGLTHSRQYSWSEHARRLSQLYQSLMKD